MNRKELAVNLHHKKFNCAQAVVCAFADTLDCDTKTIFKLAEAFGNGMSTRGTCGAVSAMAMVIGMKESDGELDNPKTKVNCYKLMKKATEMFTAKNQSVICRELKGLDGGIPLRSCDGCIEDAAAILDELLFDNME
ncbi:C-GCAxxG-C-C family protein [Anaerovoracaceae bacterium 41-7]|jgi:C_GCAxxG_C_C family probable redox protein|uniref:C_GCAxxG_C_C family protein n=1 Tax=Anaerotruncus colihominis TaxID=169435 RepID=A0A845QKF5_9FIRM|nr:MULTISPECIES: C-GCAxxG-C-C family protein [Clostridia]MCI9476656.1 C_GCAxxG_C_C family protein [Emergencia sp.]NBH60578.1 C_GCAxxG_C_C family protein [Anaerotruncus colihominis]NCE99501.1 C_GCAxxG_C_C family protein [Emergencia sp. 1XD21-10]NCF01232.1 C_GCAxxG_C_C family protein [Anaerotruncus sp. 80]